MMRIISASFRLSAAAYADWMGKIANDDDTAVAAMTVERNVRRDISVAAVVDVVSCRTVVDDDNVDTDILVR